MSLNRPRVRNALSKQLLGELHDVVEGLHREGGKGTTRALIIASEVDNAFCAGADLKERVGMSKEEYDHYRHPRWIYVLIYLGTELPSSWESFAEHLLAFHNFPSRQFQPFQATPSEVASNWLCARTFESSAQQRPLHCQKQD